MTATIRARFDLNAQNVIIAIDGLNNTFSLHRRMNVLTSTVTITTNN